MALENINLRVPIENVRFGRPGASDEECFDAAERPGAHDFIVAHRLSTLRNVARRANDQPTAA